MSVFAKICGITNKEVIDWSIELEFDSIGFVMHPQSKRFINEEHVRELARYAKGRIKTTAVGLNFNEVESVVGEVDFIQVYKTLDENDFLRISEQQNKIPEIIFASDQLPTESTLLQYNYFMFDQSKGSGEFKSVPEWVKMIKTRWLLSGGLTIGNVGQLIDMYRPFGVDVSSGLELNGKKDFELMKNFINIVKSH